jgi:hypothetical protein
MLSFISNRALRTYHKNQVDHGGGLLFLNLARKSRLRTDRDQGTDAWEDG